MNTPNKVLGAAVAVAVGLALKGCATNTETQVYGPETATYVGDQLVLCSGFNSGMANPYAGLNGCQSYGGCKSYNACGAHGCSTSACGSSGCQTFATTYVAVNNVATCSSVNGCNNKYSFHKNNNVKCRLVGYVDP